MGTDLLFVFLYLLLGIGSVPFLYLLLSMESLEPSGTPIALELRASFSARREASTPVIYFLSSLVPRSPSLYQVKITTVQQYNNNNQHSKTAVQYCMTPINNNTVRTPYIRRFPLYKRHQLLFSFSACIWKRLFPLLPEIRALRQVAN